MVQQKVAGSVSGPDQYSVLKVWNSNKVGFLLVYISCHNFG